MIIPAGYAQANLVFTGASVPSGAEMTIGLNVGTFGSGPSVAAIQVQDAILDNNVEDSWCASMTLSEVRVKYGPNETGPSGVATVGEAGDAGGVSVPPNCAVLIQKVTALGGRAGRGRMYMPGFPESLVDSSGALDTSFESTIQGVWTAFLGQLNSSDLEPVLLHAEGSPITLPTPIIELVIAPQIATQRRRLRR